MLGLGVKQSEGTKSILDLFSLLGMDVTVPVLGSHAFRLRETEFRQPKILAAVEVRWDSDDLRICTKVHR